MTKKLSPEVKTLKKAKKILETNKWTTDEYARKANGQTVVEPTDPSAKCFCALGAVCKALNLLPGLSDGNPVFTKVDSFLDLAARKILLDNKSVTDDLVGHVYASDYNDHYAKNKKDVLNMFDVAIQLARESV